MSLSASRLLYLALTLCFAVVAFLPRASAARWLDLAIAPARVLGELASPIGFLARREARAAEQSLSSAIEAEHTASRELAVDERMFALPDEERLIAGRRFLHAQVVHRFTDAPDRVECALEEQAGAELVVDLPVVLSNSYVGRVAAVDLPRGRIIVRLVTDKEFRVGASSVSLDEKEQAVAMVVGGLESTRGFDTSLALHNPSRTQDLRGVVRVDESLDPHAPFQAESLGFRLGKLALQGPERFAVVPDIDFKNGLFRIVVVLPPRGSSPAPAREFDVFAPANWRMSRAYSACEPALWREGVKIDFPASEGARADSAVVAGARLIGFVARAGALSSDVSLLGDPGVSVPAQARVDGEVAPLVLGQLISLGRKFPGGPARFRWTATQALELGAHAATSRHARLFTGAGELGVPRGLLIGECELPCSAGSQVIEVAERVDARLLRKVYVWRGIELEAAGRERAP